MRKHKFYFTGTNANFADVLNALKGIFGVDVLPYLKNEKPQQFLIDSFRGFDDNRDDLLPVGSSDLQRAIEEGWLDTLSNACKKNAVSDVVSLWDKMRTYFLDNAATKTFLYNPVSYKYTVTDKPKVIIKEPEIKPAEPVGVKPAEPKPLIVPPEDAGRDQKLRYFTQLGNTKGYTWDQGFKRNWYALANTLPVLDQVFIKQHIDFMINQQKNNPTGAKNTSKDEVKDFKQAVEFIPFATRERYKAKKGVLWYLFASPKTKAAQKQIDENNYLKAVAKEEAEFIQAEQNQMQKNANIRKLIADKTALISTTKSAVVVNDLKQQIENLKKQLK